MLKKLLTCSLLLSVAVSCSSGGGGGSGGDAPKPPVPNGEDKFLSYPVLDTSCLNLNSNQEIVNFLSKDRKGLEYFILPNKDCSKVYVGAKINKVKYEPNHDLRTNLSAIEDPECDWYLTDLERVRTIDEKVKNGDYGSQSEAQKWLDYIQADREKVRRYEEGYKAIHFYIEHARSEVLSDDIAALEKLLVGKEVLVVNTSLKNGNNLFLDKQNQSKILISKAGLDESENENYLQVHLESGASTYTIDVPRKISCSETKKRQKNKDWLNSFVNKTLNPTLVYLLEVYDSSSDSLVVKEL